MILHCIIFFELFGICLKIAVLWMCYIAIKLSILWIYGWHAYSSKTYYKYFIHAKLIFIGIWKSQFYACHVAIELCLYFILLVKRFNDHLIKKITMTGVKFHEDLPMLFTHGIWPKYSFLWEKGNIFQQLNFEISLSLKITRCQIRRQSNSMYC